MSRIDLSGKLLQFAMSQPKSWLGLWVSYPFRKRALKIYDWLEGAVAISA